MSDFYGTAEELKNMKGVKPDSLGLQHAVDPEAATLAKLTEFLETAKEYIDGYTKRDFTKELADGEIERIPRVVTLAALRIGSNAVAYIRALKGTDVVKITDYKTQIFQARIFTQEIKEDLSMLVAEAPKQTSKNAGFKMRRVRSRSEVEGLRESSWL